MVPVISLTDKTQPMLMTYSFNNAKSQFFTLLKKRVTGYFTENDIHQAGNTRLLFKSAILISAAAGLYVILVFFTPVIWVSLPLCVLLGLNMSLIGFNVMHDGGHHSFSKHRLLNTAAAHFLNVLGGTAYFWQIKHNVNHHTYTNIEGMDSDIDVKPFMRLHEGQPLRYYHRFQHIYWFILYGISYVVWIFYEDFQKYLSGRISANSPQKRLPLSQHLVFWFTKAVFVFFYIVLPILFVGWMQWLIGFLVATFVCGVTISIVFQLAHVVEGTQFFGVNERQDKPDWAIQQVRSTADFATGSRLLHWMLGGLNFQIEHHLFPRISHIHYPVVSKYVRQTCAEYGIVYNEYRSMLAAFTSHLKHLYRLGRPLATSGN
jgi:linoleoyl-CoA desaturase